MPPEIVDAGAVESGDHEHAIERHQLADVLGQRQETLFFLDPVDLVQHADAVHARRFELVDDARRIVIDTVRRIDHQYDRVRVLSPAPGRIDHGPVEPALGIEDAGRIDEHELAFAFERNAAHRHPRRLHLVRDDRDLGADDGVDERRLAGIGRTQHGDEPAAVAAGIL